MGIFTGKDLKEKSAKFLTEHFKKVGGDYYNIVRGIQHSKVKTNRIQKSVATEHTFITNLTSEVYMLEKLERIAGELENRLKKSKIMGKTITLKIKYSDFSIQTRSKTLQNYFNDKNSFFELVKELLYQEELHNSVRLLGISLTNLNTNHKQKEEIFNIQLKLEF